MARGIGELCREDRSDLARGLSDAVRRAAMEFLVARSRAAALFAAISATPARAKPLESDDACEDITIGAIGDGGRAGIARVETRAKERVSL